MAVRDLPERVICRSVICPFVTLIDNTLESYSVNFSLQIDDAHPKKIRLKNLQFIDVINSTQGLVQNSMIKITIPNLCDFDIYLNTVQPYFISNNNNYEWSNYSTISQSQILYVSDYSLPFTTPFTPDDTLYVSFTLEFLY